MNEIPQSRYGPFPLLKDQDAAFMEPPAGKLSFETIIGMDEAALDARFNGHLKGQPVFSKNQYAENQVRRIEVKRIFLALLEGVSPGGKEFAQWYDRVRGDHSKEFNVGNAIQSLLHWNASNAFKARLVHLKEEVLPATSLLFPREEELDLMNKINTLLQNQNIPEVQLYQLLKPQKSILKLKTLKDNGFTAWDSERILKVFFLLSSGMSAQSVAERENTTAEIIKTIFSRRLTQKGKALLRTLRGFKS